jgi:hypothetical protein
MGRGGWTLTTEQKEAISVFMKGIKRAPPTFTPESKAEKARKISEAGKKYFANMTPEEREAFRAKRRHPYKMTKEGSQKLADSINERRAAGKLNTNNTNNTHNSNNTTQRTQEKHTMAISNNEELVNYIEQVKRKLRLFASSFDKQPIENLPRIDAFLAKMMPAETQEQFLLTPVVPGNVVPTEQKQKRKYTRHKEGSAGLSKYKAPYRQYKTAGGTLKWWDWLKFAKTGNFPSPMNPVPQSQQVK